MLFVPIYMEGSEKDMNHALVYVTSDEIDAGLLTIAHAILLESAVSMHLIDESTTTELSKIMINFVPV